MANFIYRCPNTGFYAHAWIDGNDNNDRTYLAVTCPACQRVHLINSKSGKLIGDDDD